MTSIDVYDRHRLEAAFVAMLRATLGRWQLDAGAQRALDAAVEHMAARSDAGAVEYGDRSYTVATAPQLLDQYLEERIDAMAWTMLELVRIARMRPIVDRLDAIESGLADLSSAIVTLDDLSHSAARAAATDHVVGTARALLSSAGMVTR